MFKYLVFGFLVFLPTLLLAQPFEVKTIKLLNDSITTDQTIMFEVFIEGYRIPGTYGHQEPTAKINAAPAPVFPDFKNDFYFQRTYSYLRSYNNSGLGKGRNRSGNFISGLSFIAEYRPKKAGVFKIPAFEFVFENKKYKVEKQKIWVTKAQDDGRFTLGAGERRIMYGFPIPLSTSHFVVKANDKFASNSRSVPAQHITTQKRETIIEGKAKYVQMRYYFNGLIIIQKIMPVTADLKLAEENQQVQYYRVAYEIENTDKNEQDVALTLLIDTMIDGNDAATIGLGNDTKLFETETVLKDSVPERIWVYEEAPKKDKMIAELRNSVDKEKVNEVYIGKWSEFFRTVWDVKLAQEKYKDSGMLVRWTSRKIAPKTKTTLSVYYGLPDFKMTDKNNTIGLLFDEPEMVESVQEVLYYSGGSPELNNGQAKKIDKMLKKINKKDILGISIEGYSDANGVAEENYLLSLLRAESVAKYLKKQGIASYRLMPKGYGDTFARPNYNKLKDAEDRKVVLRIVYKATKE